MHLQWIIKDNASNIINDYGPENIGKLTLLNNVNNTFKNMILMINHDQNTMMLLN